MKARQGPKPLLAGYFAFAFEPVSLCISSDKSCSPRQVSERDEELALFNIIRERCFE